MRTPRLLSSVLLVAACGDKPEDTGGETDHTSTSLQDAPVAASTGDIAPTTSVETTSTTETTATSCPDTITCTVSTACSSEPCLHPRPKQQPTPVKLVLSEASSDLVDDIVWFTASCGDDDWTLMVETFNQTVLDAVYVRTIDLEQGSFGSDFILDGNQSTLFTLQGALGPACEQPHHRFVALPAVGSCFGEVAGAGGQGVVTHSSANEQDDGTYLVEAELSDEPDSMVAWYIDVYSEHFCGPFPMEIEAIASDTWLGSMDLSTCGIEGPAPEGVLATVATGKGGIVGSFVW